MSPPLLSVSELAGYFGIPKSTVYAWTHQKSIPFYKVGRHLRFDLEKVLIHLERPSQAGCPVAPKQSYNDSLKIEEEMRRRRDLHERRLK